MKENGTFLRGLEGVRRVFHSMNRVFVSGIILRYFATPETIKTFARDIAQAVGNKRREG